MYHTHEVEGSSPPAPTNKKTTFCEVVFLFVIQALRDPRPKNQIINIPNQPRHKAVLTYNQPS